MADVTDAGVCGAVRLTHLLHLCVAFSRFRGLGWSEEWKEEKEKMCGLCGNVVVIFGMCLVIWCCG